MSLSSRTVLVAFVAFVALYLVIVPAAAQTCACIGCTTASVPAGSTSTISMTSSCTGVAYAVASNIKVKSSDGSSGFDVTLYNPANPSQYYPAGSRTAVTCFNSPLATQIGGVGYSTMALKIKCNNAFSACPMLYNVDFACLGGDKCAGVSCGSHGSCDSSTGLCACTDNYSGASCSVAPPVQPSGTSCACKCCLGAFCTAALVGYAPVSSCSSDCSSQCRSSFSSCPASGANGALSASCSSSSGGGGSGGGADSSAVAVTAYADSACSGEHKTVKGKSNTCMAEGTTNFKLTCSGSAWTASNYAATDSTCSSTTLNSVSGSSASQCVALGSGIYVQVDCSSAAGLKSLSALALVAVAMLVSKMQHLAW